MARFRRADSPVVITEAEESPQAQLRRRQIKYASMMGLRVVFLILAAALVGLEVPNAPIWVGICIVGMVALPWMAVLIANDRPARKASTFTARIRRQRTPPPALPPARENTIIDE